MRDLCKLKSRAGSDLVRSLVEGNKERGWRGEIGMGMGMHRERLLSI